MQKTVEFEVDHPIEKSGGRMPRGKGLAKKKGCGTRGLRDQLPKKGEQGSHVARLIVFTGVLGSS